MRRGLRSMAGGRDPVLCTAGAGARASCVPEGWREAAAEPWNRQSADAAPACPGAGRKSRDAAGSVAPLPPALKQGPSAKIRPLIRNLP